MKRYKWNIDELNNNIKILENMLINASDQRDKEEIKRSITWFQYLIRLSYLSKNINNNDCYNSKISFEEVINEFMSNYGNTQRILADIILDTYPIISNFVPCYDKVYTINMNNDELLEYTTDFFHTMTDSKTINQYNNFLNNNLSSLHIVSKNNSNAFGQLFLNSILRKKYIFVNRNNTLFDGFILPHELFHYFFNDSVIEDSDLYYTTELEGSFANLLVAEYLKNYPEQQSFLNNYFLNHYLDMTTSLLFGYNVVDTIIDNEFDTEIFSKKMKNFGFQHDFTLTEISNYLLEDADTNICYNFSFLGALDLLNIYREDKEKAFYILRKIRNQKRNCDIIKLFRNNGFTFMDDNYNNLKEYVKKLDI